MSPTENLPALTDDTIERMERDVFGRIADDRRRDDKRRRTRGRIWMGAGGAAAVVAIAAVIAPSVGGLVTPMGAGGSAADQPAVAPVDGGALPEADVAREGADSSGVAGLTATDQAASAPDADREIVASASASVLVDDIVVAADEVTALAEGYDGYVESMNIGTDGGGGVSPMVEDSSVIYPPAPGPGYGWISVRVPSEDLTAAIDDLEDVGEVTSVSINRADVTDQAIDLRARVEATQASVDRLTQLMAQSASIEDLIAAEVALSDRQALLESYEQQLAQLESQVAMSSLQVNLSTEFEPVEADPAGFGDGLAAGWNALVATLNGIVVALGFLIPWIVVLAIAGLIVWAIVRLVRRRRTDRSAPPSDSAPREP